MAAGEKMKTEGVGEKNEKRGKGKRKKEKKRRKNASLGLRNSKKISGGAMPPPAPFSTPPRRRKGLRPSRRVYDRRREGIVIEDFRTNFRLILGLQWGFLPVKEDLYEGTLVVSFSL